ncbi:MAG: tRNA (guanosine(37)-N1)-methyltransferase TrmD [Lachnobacterium sp.]|nr:tRNA (guanosine(37)-N1)-methyltransferase TrmD [Lachnobacterium sp.]MDY5460899.1 tRNA (guanosine(37)-N1)-methyltransferase TrmD [Agathobacter sp.]
MRFHILTLFPEMVMQGLMTSITGRAVKQNKIAIEATNIRDYTLDKHAKVDDYPYGGGAGMLMQAQPVYDAYRSVADRLPDGAKKRVIYVTPQGTPFTQQMAQDFAGSDDLILLCGHYEGIDERVLEEIVTDYVSIGDYVLTGGELASMVIVDAVARLVPEVLNNDQSAETESFHGNLLEYPQYSRPEVWHDKRVPDVLLSGNQKKIGEWRLEQSVQRTKERRPDLYAKYEELQECKKCMMRQKLLHIDMIELINRGRARIVYHDADEILLRDMISGIYFHTRMAEVPRIEEPSNVQACDLGEDVNRPDELQNWDTAEWKLLQEISKDERIECIAIHQREMVPFMEKYFHLKTDMECIQGAYTRREKLPVRGLYGPDGRGENGFSIRTLTEEFIPFVTEHYSEIGSPEYVTERILHGAVYGAFYEEKIVGFIADHEEGSIGMLYVLPEYRKRHVAMALETYCMNLAVERGEIPYGQVVLGNEASIHLQEKMGICFAKGTVVWMGRAEYTKEVTN